MRKKKPKIQNVKAVERLTLWIDNNVGIDFEIDISDEKQPRFTQVSGHKAVTDFTKDQMSRLIEVLCALFNRYNVT